jgi:hypothetical protein
MEVCTQWLIQQVTVNLDEKISIKVKLAEIVERQEYETGFSQLNAYFSPSCSRLEIHRAGMQ